MSLGTSLLEYKVRSLIAFNTSRFINDSRGEAEVLLGSGGVGGSPGSLVAEGEV